MAKNKIMQYIGMGLIQVIEFMIFSVLIALFNLYYGFTVLDNVMVRFVIALILTVLTELSIRPSKIAFRK